jgi:hypothetical protein
MKTLLQEFRGEYRSRLLDLLWRQWSALGVAGQTGSARQQVADLEALLLLTCTVGRHDARLFDEVLDWLQANGWLINVTRLKRILRTEDFRGRLVLGAVAETLAKGSETPKWKQLAESPEDAPEREKLFFGEDGRPIPVIGEPEPTFARRGLERGPLRSRGYSREFRPTEPATLALQLRALLGISVRCEILLYLLTHESAHPSQIAREAYYFERTVQGTLADMSRSGVIRVRTTGREKHYWLQPACWWRMLNRTEPSPLKWVTWPPLMSALERIWLRLQDDQLHTLDPLLQASEMRQLMLEVRPAIERAGFSRAISDDRQHLREAYLPVFVQDVRKLVE